MTKSLKQLRESAEAALEQGVGNKGALLTAVPPAHRPAGSRFPTQRGRRVHGSVSHYRW